MSSLGCEQKLHSVASFWSGAEDSLWQHPLTTPDVLSNQPNGVSLLLSERQICCSKFDFFLQTRKISQHSFFVKMDQNEVCDAQSSRNIIFGQKQEETIHCLLCQFNLSWCPFLTSDWFICPLPLAARGQSLRQSSHCDPASFVNHGLSIHIGEPEPCPSSTHVQALVVQEVFCCRRPGAWNLTRPPLICFREGNKHARTATHKGKVDTRTEQRLGPHVTGELTVDRVRVKRSECQQVAVGVLSVFCREAAQFYRPTFRPPFVRVDSHLCH